MIVTWESMTTKAKISGGTTHLARLGHVEKLEQKQRSKDLHLVQGQV